MSDKIKIGEEGRYIYVLFSDISDITTCTFYLKKPKSTAEVTLTTERFTGIIPDYRITTPVSGFRHKFVTGTFSTNGDYYIDPYIETNSGYKGRRDRIKFTVHGKYQ